MKVDAAGEMRFFDRFLVETMDFSLDKVLAKDYLQQIKDNYKDYDFENRLSVRVNNALEQLKREGTTASS
ncbi:hypothetical protein ACOMHN_056439 [Nucella lapillus]